LWRQGRLKATRFVSEIVLRLLIQAMREFTECPRTIRTDNFSRGSRAIAHKFERSVKSTRSFRRSGGDKHRLATELFLVCASFTVKHWRSAPAYWSRLRRRSIRHSAAARLAQKSPKSVPAKASPSAKYCRRSQSEDALCGRRARSREHGSRIFDITPPRAKAAVAIGLDGLDRPRCDLDRWIAARGP
jgi:hypothetical protein